MDFYKSLSLLFVNLCLTSHLFAVPLTSYSIDSYFTGASAVVAVDIDQDGHIDLAGAGYYADSISWWRNLGNQQWQRRQIQSLNGAYALRTADIDSDGDMDLIGCSRPDNSVWWYENRLEVAGTGLPVFDPHFIVAMSHEIPHSVDAADFDNDGDMDVAVAFRMDPNIHLLINVDGSGDLLGTVETLIPVVGNGVSFVKGDDFDNDGDIDIVAATPWDWEGNLNYYWLRNNGQGSFSQQIRIAGGPELNGAFSAELADIDGDGLRDIVTVSEQHPTTMDPPYVPAYSAIHWIRRLNIEGTMWSIPHAVDNRSFGSDGDRSILVRDIDGDGAVDIVSGSYLFEPRISIWRNHWYGRAWRRFDIEVGFRSHGIAAADFDSDGKLEIVGSSWGECCYTGEIKGWEMP